MRAEDPVEKITHAVPIRPQKTNGSSCRPGLFKFCGRDHISYCTTVRGPDILCNVILYGYVAFYQINTFLQIYYFFIIGKMCFVAG